MWVTEQPSGERVGEDAGRDAGPQRDTGPQRDAGGQRDTGGLRDDGLVIPEGGFWPAPEIPLPNIYPMEWRVETAKLAAIYEKFKRTSGPASPTR